MQYTQPKNSIRIMVLLALITGHHRPPAEQTLEPLNAYDIGAACLDDKNASSTEICYAFILGVAQAQQSFIVAPAAMPRFCLPEGVSRRRAINAVRKHFRRHAGNADQPADVFVVDALMRAFPCE